MAEVLPEKARFFIAEKKQKKKRKQKQKKKQPKQLLKEITWIKGLNGLRN